MRFRHEIRYDATAAEVFAMLSDPSFRQRSAETEQVEEWSSNRAATNSIATPGKPTSISGTLTLVEAGNATWRGWRPRSRSRCR